MAKKKIKGILPIPTASFDLSDTVVEVPVQVDPAPQWVGEDLIVAALQSTDAQDMHAERAQIRAILRRMAKRGEIQARRHPEHGWWEYAGTGIWEQFRTRFAAAAAAEIIRQSNA